MTTLRKFLERSRHFLQRILRKPAWDFNRFRLRPAAGEGTAVEVPSLMQALL